MKFKTETHLHTHKHPIEEIIKLYKNANYSTIIITNHYNSKHLDKLELITWEDKINNLNKENEAAKKYGEIYGINVLFAIELTLKETKSDYLIYGVTERFLRENTNLYDLSLEELYNLCIENNFLLIQAHPFRLGIELAPKQFVMGIEIYNGETGQISRNELAEKYATDNKLVGTSGSDFHTPNDFAKGGIVTDKEIVNIQDYIKAVKENNFEIIKDGI